MLAIYGVVYGLTTARVTGDFSYVQTCIRSRSYSRAVLAIYSLALAFIICSINYLQPSSIALFVVSAINGLVYRLALALALALQ